jgi:hypothetical protein
LLFPADKETSLESDCISTMAYISLAFTATAVNMIHGEKIIK